MTDLAAILNGYFAGGTVPTTLYVGFVRKTNFTGLSPTSDTMGSHAGWEEFEDYDEATRQEWTPGVVVGDYPALVNNPSPAVITPSESEDITAVFLCDDDTIGGTTGQLYGPWFYEEGDRTTVVGSPFKADVTIYLSSNTPTVG